MGLHPFEISVASSFSIFYRVNIIEKCVIKAGLDQPAPSN
jgi:hypothetical protein